MLGIVDLIFKEVVDKGYTEYVKNKEFKTHVKAIKERLKLELRLNIEIISAFFPEANYKESVAPHEFSKAFNAIRTSAFSSLSDGVIPLSEIFSEKIENKIFYESNQKYKEWCSNDKHLYQLIERTYLKLEVTKAYTDFSESKIDIGYLKFLILSCIKALK